MKYALLTMLALFSLTACGGTDREQARKTEAMVKAANDAVGMPNIVNFTEKRFAKLIYELKDEEVTTYTYILDMNGKLHFLCDSIGYGLNASVQYVNPERYHTHGATLPQPEPNGLFMPEGLAATFVLCSDGKGGVRPIYSEPELIVSPFKLKQSSSLQ